MYATILAIVIFIHAHTLPAKMYKEAVAKVH